MVDCGRLISGGVVGVLLLVANGVVAVLLGVLILGESLTSAMIIGGVLIVGAVVLVVRRSPPSH